MKKKLLGLSLMFSLMLPSFAQAASLTFSDVPAGETSTVAIEYLVKKGTLKGYPDGTFQPAKTIIRAEMMKVIVAGQGIHPQAGEYTPNCFSDVKAGEWYEPYVCYAYDKGWVSGYPDGTFQPAKTIVRAEGAKMLVNGMQLGEASEMDMIYAEMFNDVTPQDWFAPFVSKIAATGIEAIASNLNFTPSEPMTRRMAAEFIFGANIYKSTQKFVNYDTRKEFLAAEGMADLEALAYIDSSDGAYLLKTYITFPDSAYGGCTNPTVRLDNQSGETIDYSKWYLKYVADYDGDSLIEISKGIDYYPFAGVSLAPGETRDVKVTGYFGDLGTDNVYTYLYTYNDWQMSWAVCSE